MAPPRPRKQRRKAAWTQGGGCGLAILSAGHRSPFPGLRGLAAPSCSNSASGQSSAVERQMTSELFLKLVVCSSNSTGLEGRKGPRGHRPMF